MAQEGAKTAHRERLTRLVAPVAVTVQQLAAHTTGGVVTAAQALMVVVTDDAEVMAEATIDNKDIGFIRVGQAAEVKIEAFNFTRYGTVPATVAWLSADAVVNQQHEAMFQAVIKLNSSHMQINGLQVRLNQGLDLAVELKTGKRRLIEYLFTPLSKQLSQSGRER